MNGINVKLPAAVPHAGAEAFDTFCAANPELEFIDAVFCDLSGSLRGKRLPISDARRVFESGMQIPEDIFTLDAKGEMTDPLGRGFGDGDPDGTGFAIPDTLVTVGKPPTRRGQVLMTLYNRHGRPSDLDPRHVLNGVVQRLSELQLTPVVAVELEFYLMDQARVSGGIPQPPLCPATGERENAISVYSVADLDRYDAFLRDVAAEAERWAVPATAATSEYGPGQFEINLRHVADPLIAADHAAMLRQIVKNVAREHGMQASFMAKPYTGRAGSGMHVHMSLLDADGRNVFADPAPEGSPVLRHAIGGLGAIMHEAMAFFAPTVNGYRRFVPNLFVPMNRRWGVNNRSTGLRVPLGDPESRRVEHRVAGADANPYLVLAALLAGVHHGLINQIDPGEPYEGNASDFADPTVPFDFGRALDTLANAHVMRIYLGDYVDIYVAAKRTEFERYNRTIPAHEYDWYL